MNLEQLRRLVLTKSNNDNMIALFKCFARDVARAMLKELWSSVGLGKDPTEIKAQTFAKYQDCLLVDKERERHLKHVIHNSNLEKLFQDFISKTGYSPQKTRIKDSQVNLYERTMVVWYLSLLDKIWTFS